MDNEILSRFELKEKIGIGSFSITFKAYDKINNRLCALKIINKENLEIGNEMDYQLGLIRNEIKISKICKSNYFVKFYDAFETKKSIVIVLELCDENLDIYINKNPRYNIYFIQKLFIDLNNALIFLYQNHIIHRDIKPENIFLKYENNGNIIPKLGDFGASTVCQINEKKSEMVGTTHYMAPEILKEEKYNYKSDLFSLGVVLYKLLFHEYPFKGKNKFQILNYMKKYKTFNLKKTGLPSLDNLLLGLLELSEEKRLSITQYINHPFFKENPFYLNQLIIEAKKNKKNNNFTDKIQKEAYIDNRIIEEAYIDNLKETAFLDKITEKPYNDIFQDLDELESINIADYATSLLNIMEIPNAYAKETKVIKREKLIKIANILYYNESIQEYLIEIEEDSYYFEKKTSGAFILCTNIFSFNLVLEEIKKYNSEKDKRVLFNLIVPGSQFQKVMNNLIKFKYEHIFLNICIYCINIEKYSNLCKQYKKIYGVYNDREQILKFIENISSDKIRVFPTTKVITYNEFKDKYYERHEKISEFYGDLTKETYKKYSSKLANYIYSADEEELGETKKDDLIESFKTFDIKKDLKKLHSLIIKEYTKCNIYIPLNKWLRTFKEGVYEIIAYYTARLMYALNCYGKSSNSFLKKNLILFRGESVNYINVLPFERLKGKIILFSGFTSTSEDYQIAENYSNRKISEKAFKEKHKFSVIYKIHNYIKSNSIYCGIDIHKLSEYKDEKEILFQPFSFYFVKNVIFNYDKYTVDIDLEIIPKKEILEKKIRNKEKVIYNKEENIMVIEEKQIEKTIQKKEIKSQEENNCKII